MGCIGPVTPTDSELLAHVDKEAGPAVIDHLNNCYRCRIRGLELAREQRSLQKLLYRAGCPPPLQLGEYQLGMLTDAGTARVAEHLRYCPACRAEVSDLTAFLVHLRRSGRESVRDTLGELRTLVAQLATAAPGGPMAAPVPVTRETTDETHRPPAVYFAEDILVTVDSWVEQAGAPGCSVAGLVAGPVDLKDADVSISVGDELPVMATVDRLGNFLFANVSPGTHDLLVRLPATGLQIAIEGLVVE